MEITPVIQSFLSNRYTLAGGNELSSSWNVGMIKTAVTPLALEEGECFMNTSEHVISIEKRDGSAGGTLFRAPADNLAARQLWVFLVENLQPGFVVELSSQNGAAELTRPSGDKMPIELYARIMDSGGGE